MKPKENPEPKVQTSKTNTKKLSEIPGSEKKTETSLLKKNEFTMILIGALLLTLIVFFFFFRTSGPVSQPVPANPTSSTPSRELENRIGKMEEALQAIEKSVTSEGSNTKKEKSGNNLLEERLARLETAFSVKMESMIERIGKIEKHITQLTAKPDNASEEPPAKKETIAKQEPAAAVTSEKKVVKKEKKEAIFHTVQKGETLFSISRKYNISVEALRKLNNLSSDTAIFPGNNILVK